MSVRHRVRHLCAFYSPPSTKRASADNPVNADEINPLSNCNHSAKDRIPRTAA